MAGDAANYKRDAIRFVHFFSMGLTWSPAMAARLVTWSGIEPYSGDMLSMLSLVSVEGEPLNEQLAEYAQTLPYKPLSGALQSLLGGAETEDILQTLKNFVRSEIELESKELDQKLGMRITLAFVAMTILVTASVAGSIPKTLLPRLSWAIASSAAAYLITKRIRRRSRG